MLTACSFYALELTHGALGTTLTIAALGAAALGAAVYQACQELGLAEVPRMWLQIIARKG